MKLFKTIIIYFVISIMTKSIHADNSVDQIVSNIIENIKKTEPQNKFIEKESNKFCPIIFAVSKGKYKSLENLLANQEKTYQNATLDINAQNKDGQTAIIYSIATLDINDFDSYEIIKKLLDTETINADIQLSIPPAPPIPPQAPPQAQAPPMQITTPNVIPSGGQALLAEIRQGKPLKKADIQIKPKTTDPMADILAAIKSREKKLKPIEKEQKAKKIAPLEVEAELKEELLNFPQKIETNKSQKNTKNLNKEAIKNINEQIDKSQVNEEDKNKLKKIMEYYTKGTPKALKQLAMDLLVHKIAEIEHISRENYKLIEIQINSPEKIDNKEKIENLKKSIEYILIEFGEFFDSSIEKYLKKYLNVCEKKLKKFAQIKQKEKKKTTKKKGKKKAETEKNEEEEKAKKEFEERAKKIEFNWEKTNKNTYKIFENINNSLELNKRNKFLEEKDISNLKEAIKNLLENESFTKNYVKIFDKPYKKNKLFDLLKNLDFQKAEISYEEIKKDFSDEK